MQLYSNPRGSVIKQCTKCHKWWKPGNTVCLVVHIGDGCCHHGDTGDYVAKLPEPSRTIEELPESISDVVCKHCNNPEHTFRLEQQYLFNGVRHFAVYEDGMDVWLNDGMYTNRSEPVEGKQV